MDRQRMVDALGTLMLVKLEQDQRIEDLTKENAALKQQIAEAKKA